MPSLSKIKQEAVSPNVSGNGPAFSAYKNTHQTGLSSATWTKVSFQFEEWDTNNNYDKDTNYRFQPSIAGYYQINWELDVGGITSSIVISDIYKNSSNHRRTNGIATSNTESYVSGAALVYMNGSTDYVEIYVYVGGAGATIYGGGSGNYSFFQGFLARAA
jgi:hypothetical protein